MISEFSWALLGGAIRKWKKRRERKEDKPSHKIRYDLANGSIGDVFVDFVSVSCEGEGEMIRHSEELAKDDAISVWRDIKKMHLLDCAFRAREVV